jgi:hypothetical protein
MSYSQKLTDHKKGGFFFLLGASKWPVCLKLLAKPTKSILFHVFCDFVIYKNKIFGFFGQIMTLYRKKTEKNVRCTAMFPNFFTM